MSSAEAATAEAARARRFLKFIAGSVFVFFVLQNRLWNLRLKNTKLKTELLDGRNSRDKRPFYNAETYCGVSIIAAALQKKFHCTMVALRVVEKADVYSAHAFVQTSIFKPILKNS